MKETRVLICSSDEIYTNAMVSFLMRWETKNRMGLSVYRISSIEEIDNLSSSFDFGLMEADFLAAFSRISGVLIRNVLMIHEDSEKREDKEGFYKYQSMEKLISLIMGNTSRQTLEHISGTKGSTKVTSIYSPCSHELSLPFALSVCKSFGELGETLFVDLEEICVLPALMDIRFENDLVDLMYMLENENNIDVSAHLTSFEGINILPPPGSPSQLSFLDVKQWEKLFERIIAMGFKNIVILFGGQIQGMSNMLSYSENIYILGRDGDYYSLMENVFVDYLEMLGIRNKSRVIHLPMSAHNLKTGTYRLEGLVSGNMLDFIRKEL